METEQTLDMKPATELELDVLKIGYPADIYTALVGLGAITVCLQKLIDTAKA